jgi:hypothetical protein
LVVRFWLGGRRLANKQARGLILGKQRKGLLTCLLVYCLYIINLVVVVVGNRPLVFFELISSARGNVNSAIKPF